MGPSWFTAEQDALLVEWASTSRPQDRHLSVKSWNWDAGTDFLHLLIAQPDCEKATALHLFWFCYELAGGVPKDENNGIDPADTEEYALMLDIVQRWRAGFYVNETVGFRLSDLGFRSDTVNLFPDHHELAIPPSMTVPIEGPEARESCELAEGVPFSVCYLYEPPPAREEPAHEAAAEEPPPESPLITIVQLWPGLRPLVAEKQAEQFDALDAGDRDYLRISVDALFGFTGWQDFWRSRRDGAWVDAWLPQAEQQGKLSRWLSGPGNERLISGDVFPRLMKVLHGDILIGGLTHFDAALFLCQRLYGVRVGPLVPSAFAGAAMAVDVPFDRRFALLATMSPPAVEQSHMIRPVIFVPPSLVPGAVIPRYPLFPHI